MLKNNGCEIAPILLILQNPEEINAIKRIFKAINPNIPVIYVKRINNSIAYFQGRGIYSERHLYPIPQLILLDLDLPDAYSLNFLEWLKSQNRFQNIPVVILNNSCPLEYKQLITNYGAELVLNQPLPFSCSTMSFNSLCQNLIKKVAN